MTITDLPPAARRAAIAYAVLSVTNIVLSDAGVRVGDWITKPMLMPLLAVFTWYAAKAATGASASATAFTSTSNSTSASTSNSASNSASASASASASVSASASAGSLAVSSGASGALSPAFLRSDLRLPLAGILLGGAGDTALIGKGNWFLVGMGCFAAGHVCYLLTLRRRGALAAVGRPALGGYAAAWVVLLALCWSGLGSLLVPVVAYSLLLVGMALAASGLSRTAAIGGALFLISDAFIALDLAKVHLLPHQSTLVMPTYVAAQFLLALAWSGVAPARRSQNPVLNYAV
ncbi:hypothetical protein GCM10009839_78210 [Catenulispora yoronensis]|uniref:Lysoplasmalogenase n=1 Tax=Catenulispora yoronensis TaxID=450799 RepID=A0ABP5GVD6_9ACTN